MGAFITPGGIGGGAAVTWPLLAGVDGTPTSPAYSWGADTDIGIRRGGADNLRLVTAGVDRLVIDSAGNVGIGTPTPGGARLAIIGPRPQLQIQGDDGTFNLLRMRVYSSVAGWHANFFDMLRARGTSASPAVVADGDRLFAFEVSGHDGTAFQKALALQGNVDGTPSAGIVPGRWDFVTTDSGGTHTVRMVVKASGNVGIGTTEPTEKLDIRGNYLKIKNNADASGGIVFDVGSTSAQIVQYIFRDRGADKFYQRKNLANDLDFIDASGNTSLYLKQGGNVGIGTTSPGYKLHVVGDIKYTGSLVAGDIQFANKVRITEEGMSLVFENPLGERIAKLDSWGNLIIKGKVFEKMEV